MENKELPIKKTSSKDLPLRIFLEGEVCERMANEFVQVIYKQVHLHKDIEIYVNSPGGDVYAGMTITDLILNLHQTHNVSTIGLSMVMSSAVDIFMAGVNRHALRSCRFMQHYPAASVRNAKPSELEELLSELDADMRWGLIHSTRDSLLTPMQLLAYIEEARNQDFFYDYEFAKEHLLVNRDGLPPVTKGKCITISGSLEDE